MILNSTGHPGSSVSGRDPDANSPVKNKLNDSSSSADAVRTAVHSGVYSVPSLVVMMNLSGETVLSLAMGHGHVEIVQWLLDVGSTPSYETVQQCKMKQKVLDDIPEKRNFPQ